MILTIESSVIAPGAGVQDHSLAYLICRPCVIESNQSIVGASFGKYPRLKEWSNMGWTSNMT